MGREACSKDFYSNQDEGIVVGYDFKQEDEDKAMECPICMLLLRQTMGTPCSHLFCLVCLQKLTGRRDIRVTTFKCPVCNHIVDTNQVFPNVYIDCRVRGSNVYCQQHKKGCIWKGTIAEYFNKHENKCDFKVVSCKYEGCEISAMRSRMMKDHELHCPFRMVQCNHCTFEVKESELDKHYQSCERFPTNCKENGCNAIVPKNEMVEHLSICDFVIVDCPYMRFGCLNKVARKNIEKHLEINTQRHMMLVCEKYHNMEGILRNTTELIEIQSANIVKQDTEIERLKTDNATHFINTENQKKQIEQLKKRISLLEATPKVTLATNESEQNLKNPSCPVDTNELLLKGADRWIRKKKIDFDENIYDVWFKKIFDLMDENKLYQYNDTIYVKVNFERRKSVNWCSNSKKQQEKISQSENIIHKDGLLLRVCGNWLEIYTEPLDVFNHDNSSFIIIHPQQQRKIKRMVKRLHCNNVYGYWFVCDVPYDFHVNNFIIVCLINN